MICNPPYFMAEQFFETLESAYQHDDSTKAIFIIPYKKSPLLKKLIDANHWKLTFLFLKGSDLFVKSYSDDPLDETKKDRIGGAVQHILVWEMNRTHLDYPTLDLRNLPDLDGNMIGFIKEARDETDQLASVPRLLYNSPRSSLKCSADQPSESKFFNSV